MFRPGNRFNRLFRGRNVPYQPPLLHWALAFASGAALALTEADVWIIGVAAALTTLFAVSSAARIEAISSHPRINVTLLLLTPALIGIGYWRADETRLQAYSVAWADLGEQTVRLQGIVADEPQLRGGGMRLLLDAESIQVGAEQRALDDQIQLHIPDVNEIDYGDRIAVQAVLTPTLQAEDEYLQWLANHRIAASALVRPGSLELVGQSNLAWWRSLAADARQALNQSLRIALPPPLSGVAQGMITGRRDAIDPELRSDLNDTSLSHLIVISGSNLTLLTTIVMAASAWLLGRRPAAALAILAALSYGTLIGPDPPVQRAMWMAIVFAAAHMLGRGSSALYAIAATVALMVAIEPHILLDLSFQLTLAGTLGIIILMPSLSQDFLSGQGGIVGSLRDVALVTLVATLATMPLIVLHFERAALIGIPANLLVTPLFTWTLLGSAATAVIGLLSSSLATTLSWGLAWLPLRWLVLVAEEGARLPGAGASTYGFGHLHLVVVYGAILAASFRPHRERISRWNRTVPTANTGRMGEPLRRVGLEVVPDLRSHLSPALVSGVATAVASALWLSACSAPPDQLKVHFIDVGQGDSALLITPDDQTILIDTGERSDALLAALRTHMPDGARQIDLAVITHPQSDHGEALWAILDHYDVEQVLLSAYTNSTSFGQRLLDLLERRGVPSIQARPGQQIVFKGHTDLTLDILWPPIHGLPEDYQTDPNSTSIVLRARYGKAAFLFTGDINVEQELDLVRNPCAASSQRCELRADVLKVAHQGSRFSSSMLFLESVRPTFAILSAGVGNPHGHPHDEVLASLSSVGATSLLTSVRGDISFATNGHSISLTTER